MPKPEHTPAYYLRRKERIKNLRDSKGWTFERIGAVMQISRQRVHAIYQEYPHWRTRAKKGAKKK